MAIHSSILAWRIPRTEEPGDLQSVRYDCSDLAHVKVICPTREFVVCHLIGKKDGFLHTCLNSDN